MARLISALLKIGLPCSIKVTWTRRRWRRRGFLLGSGRATVLPGRWGLGRRRRSRGSCQAPNSRITNQKHEQITSRAALLVTMKYRTSPTRHLLRVSSVGRKGVCAAPMNWELWLRVLQCSQPFPQDTPNLLSVLSTPRHCGRRSKPCACKILAHCKHAHDTCRVVIAGIERNKKL